jgi:hypothetical protein
MKKENKNVDIYKVDFKDDGTTYYFKGVDDLREFAETRIEDGWDTKFTIEELQSDERMIEFLIDDYGVDVEILMSVTPSDFLSHKTEAIVVALYSSEDDDGNKVYDKEEITRDFEEELSKLN